LRQPRHELDKISGVVAHKDSASEAGFNAKRNVRVSGFKPCDHRVQIIASEGDMLVPQKSHVTVRLTAFWRQ
jgi:hypothetical protein